MSETPHKKPDFLELAKHQLAQISAEVEKALEAVKDPDRPKELTASYLDMLQKGLSKAQDSVAKYQQKMAQTPSAAPKDGMASGTSPAADPMATGTESEPPTI